MATLRRPVIAGVGWPHLPLKGGNMLSQWQSLGIRARWSSASAFCLVTVLAAGALAGNHRAATGVSVLENTPNRVVIQYSIPDLTYTSVQVDGAPYLQVGLAGEAQLLIAGAPDLPHVARSIVIPDNGVMTVRVADAEYDDLPGIDLAPSKGNLLRTVNPDDVPYTFGGAYGTNAFFPGDVAALHEPYILRDCRGVVVDVYPVQYNPVTRTLRVYRSVTVDVARTADGGANVLQRGAIVSRPSVSFEKLYAAHFINYVPDQRYNPLDEQGDMLVIYYDAWLPNIQPFVDHKNAIGINTTAVGVSTIGNNATAIKNYIQSLYNSSDLAFVLLVGDAAQVATPSASGGSSDPTYSKLAGGDNYPDIMVGRFSAETAAQVDTQVQRSVEYEENAATTLPWFWRGIGIASAQGAGQGDEGQADYVHIGEIRQWLLNWDHDPPYTLVDEIYDTNGGTAQDVTNGLNAGRGIINYCGHGSTTSWGTTGFSNSNVAALQNDNMLPFIISVACVNGQFDGYTCFAEAWMRSTHNGEPIGAIATYMSSVNQSWAPPMEAQDEFNILYTQIEANEYFSYGVLCFAGSCSMMDAYGTGGVDMFNTWIVFGDPSIRIVGTTIPPHGLGVEPKDEGFASQGPLGGPFTPESMDFTVKNLDKALPVDYEVTATQNWVSVDNGVGTLPPDGSTIVTVSINSQANFLGTGMFYDTVTFANTTDHTGDTTRPVSLKVGEPTLQYAFTLDSDPGWPVQGEWAFGQPMGQGGSQSGGYGFPDPTSGATGTNVLGVNLNGNYSTTYGGPWYVTLGPVDLTATSEVSLKFQRWLNSDFQPYVYATIDASNDNATWTSIWSNGSLEIKDNAWSQKVYDLSAVATNQPTVWVRWGYKVSNGANAYSGWNVDDIEIWGLHATGPLFQPGDLNCDHVVDFGDINAFVLALTDAAGYAAAHPDCNIQLADINGDGVVDFADINPFIALLTQ
jgi:hypothetical protein